MTTSDPLESLALTAAALARAAGVTLEIDPAARSFATDGNKIVVPALETLRTLYEDPAELQAYVLGGIEHEAGHIHCTDREARKEWMQQFAGHPKERMAIAVGQIIEDSVMETAHCKTRPGARLTLTKLWEVLARKTGLTQAGEDNEDQVLVQYVFRRSRHAFARQQWSLDAARAARAIAVQSVGEERVSALDAELLRLDFARDTHDSVAIASSVLAQLGVEPVAQVQPEGRPEGSGPPGGGDGASSEASDGGDASGDAGAPAGPCEGAGEGSSPAVTLEEAEDDAQEHGADGGLAVAVGGPAEPTGTRAQVVAVVPGQTGTSEYGTRRTRIVAGMGERLKLKVLAQTMMATSRLSTLLRAQGQGRTVVGKSGKLVPTRLWKLKAGNTRIFRKTIDGETLSTAIYVLLDVSKSMDDQIERAKLATAFVPVAMEGVEGVQTSIASFPGYRRALNPVKAFDESVAVGLDRLAAVRANGGTPLGAALRLALPVLLDCEVDRRLLLVVTDGKPDDKDSAQAMLRSAELEGVEVIGLGIGRSLRGDLAEVFSDYVCIDSVGELTNALCSVLERKLTKLPLAA